MKTPRLLAFLGLAVLSVLLSLSSPVHAGDPPRLDDVREILEKAWGADADSPPSVADRTQMLKDAMKLLKGAPWSYHGHKVKAMEFIDSALYELNKGDPDHKATDYIHSAVIEIRDIT